MSFDSFLMEPPYVSSYGASFSSWFLGLGPSYIELPWTTVAKCTCSKNILRMHFCTVSSVCAVCPVLDVVYVLHGLSALKVLHVCMYCMHCMYCMYCTYCVCCCMNSVHYMYCVYWMYCMYCTKLRLLCKATTTLQSYYYNYCAPQLSGRTFPDNYGGNAILPNQLGSLRISVM